MSPQAHGILKRIILVLVIACLIGFGVAAMSPRGSTEVSQTSMSWSDAISRIATDPHVTGVVLGPESIMVTSRVVPKQPVPASGTRASTQRNQSVSTAVEVVYPGGSLSAATQDAVERAVAEARTAGRSIPIRGSLDKSMDWTAGLMAAVIALIAISILVQLLVVRKGPGGAGRAGFVVDPEQIATRFTDVAGIDEAKAEVEEVVSWFRHHERYLALNAKPPRGILIAGPPGTGKTMLAKAVAGEASVSFIALAGSDFVEMFVGVGAARVRDLFRRAREAAPCVIFIDEIDAIGRARSNNQNTNQEAENTLNAILCELDGMRSDSRIMVMAATNRPELLDQALIRPGRFDRHIHLHLPDLHGREAILAAHARKYKLAHGADLQMVARQTAGFSGAALATMLNEAALFAARRRHAAITSMDLVDARNRIAFGMENRSRAKAMSDADKRTIAIHEAGHAVAQIIIKQQDVDLVTIIPRGQALGAMISLPERDRYNVTARECRNDIAVLLAGHIAESLWCDDVSAGAANDLERATSIAERMVDEFGMDGQIMVRRKRSMDLDRNDSDRRIQAILSAEFSRAKEVLTAHREWLHRIVDALLDVETITGARIQTLRHDVATVVPTEAASA